jgi:putative MATE family efflux protein
VRAVQTRRDLTTGSLASSIWHLAVPLIVQGVLMDLFNIVDMIYVGRLGAAAIAAVSIGGVVMGLIRMLVTGISTGTVALVSRFVGEKKPQEARDVVGQSILLSAVGAVVVAILGWFFSEPMLRLLGAADDVIPDGVAYLRVMCVGGITMFLTMTLAAGMRGFGDAVTPMWAMGIASVANIGLDPVMIFGLLGFPRWGVAGSAVATVISRGVATAILVWALVRRGRDGGGTGFRIFPLPGGESYVGRTLKIGSFSAVRMLSMNVSRLVLVRIAAVFGTFAVAAFGIGLRIRIFVLMLGFGLADATAVVVGQNLGAGKPDRAEKSAWLSVGYFGVLVAVMSVAFLAVPRLIIGIFNTDPEVLDMGSRYLRFFVPALVALDFASVFARAIEGAGDTLPTMVITGVCLVVVGIPLAWWFSRLWGVDGLWAAFMLADVLQGVGTTIVFRAGRWKSKRLGRAAGPKAEDTGSAAE